MRCHKLPILNLRSTFNLYFSITFKHDRHSYIGCGKRTDCLNFKWISFIFRWVITGNTHKIVCAMRDLFTIHSLINNVFCAITKTHNATLETKLLPWTSLAKYQLFFPFVDVLLMVSLQFATVQLAPQWENVFLFLLFPFQNNAHTNTHGIMFIYKLHSTSFV